MNATLHNGRTIIAFALAAFCAGTVTAASPSPNQEHIPASEPAAIRSISAFFSGRVQGDYEKRGHSALRDVHAKGHGCVLARFTVRKGLTPALRVGVFASPTVYDAFIRYSNGADAVQNDRLPDGRGIAIKLLGVPGTKLLADEKTADTQDFLGIDFPVFFVKDAAEYVDLNKAQAANDFLGFLKTHPETARVIAGLHAQKVGSPLTTRYFSQTAFEIGGRYMKYSFDPAPCPNASPLPAATPGANDDYMARALATTLANGPACLHFSIQLQTDPATQPIEDGEALWNEQQAPFVTVADAYIPKQTFESPKQTAFCENLSLTVWHSLPVFKPVGGLNRTRKLVYEEVSHLRHRLNHAQQIEPTVATYRSMENPT